MMRRFFAVSGLLVVGALLTVALGRRDTTFRPVAPVTVPSSQAELSPAASAVPAAHLTPGPGAVRSLIPVARRPRVGTIMSASVPVAGRSLSVLGRPSVTASLIDATLQREGSPLYGLGAYIVADARRWDVDPVFALAFITYFDGRAPLLAAAHNVGHIVAVTSEPALEGYRAFPSWRAGIDAWFALIGNLYVRGWHLTTLDQIVPVYAPGNGRRDVEATLDAMRALIEAWRLAT